ncbi:MAG: hypothetical protein FJ320_12535 [SAR202 cluster bacterium]|nr:hypothetical protein [SAR202 cluster bacterium]
MENKEREKDETQQEVLRGRADEKEWESIFRYGERKARELGIKPEDVERLIDEYREEKKQRRNQRLTET